MAPKRKATAVEEAPVEAPASKASEPIAKAGKLLIGQQFPSLGPLETDEDTTVDLTEVLKTHGVILFFYPRANTPGCTNQACGMRDNLQSITNAGYKIFGMSADKPKSQANWRQKHSFGYNLLCDPEGGALKTLGVLKGPKSVSRSHIIIEKGGKVLLADYGVSPKDSVTTVAAHVTGEPAAAAEEAAPAPAKASKKAKK